MTAIVDICNRALARVGNDQPITSIDEEQSKGARNCRLFYDTARDSTLRSYPWNFATTAVALATVGGDAPPGWQYAYGHPSDAVRILAVMDEDGLRTALRVPWQYEAGTDDWWRTMPFNRVEWDIMRVAGDKVIVTDLEDAYVLYTARVTDPNEWDVMFTDALAWRLAMDLAMPMSGRPDYATSAAQAYSAAIAEARATQGNERKAAPPRQSPAATGRY